jgi:hypothetical protein|tara:strand:- start:140 stop:499 length:360 start_codon:yes stop_codon:yes gene_type:complete
MKLSDTIIGSIIIGVLVGGAILYSGGGNQDRKHAQIKVLAAPHGEMSSKEIIIDEEIIIDNESDSSMKWHYKSDDLKGDLPGDISDIVEKAITEALDGLPKDLDIKVEINSKKIEGEVK